MEIKKSVFLWIFLMGILATTLMNSCYIQKRVYVPGYQIEYNKKEHQSKKQASVSSLKNRSETQKPTVATEKLSSETTNCKDNNTVSSKVVIASKDNKETAFIVQENIRGYSSSLHKEAESSHPTSNTISNSKQKKQPKFKDTESSGPNVGAMVKTGYIFSILGLICLIPPLIIFGWIFSVVGIILCALALRKKTKETLTKKQKLMAKSGLVMGIIGLLATIAGFVTIGIVAF